MLRGRLLSCKNKMMIADNILGSKGLKGFFKLK